MSNQVIETSEVAGTLRPLCVDLDGTLVKSDTLVDSLLVIVRRNPRLLASLPGWILRGKASFKAAVTSQVVLDVARLPYNRKLLEFLHAEALAGRKLYLATGADGTLARRIATHLGIFEGVLASDGETNLVGSNKLARLQQLFGAEGFDYIGNATPDLPLLTHAGNAMVANPNLWLRGIMRFRKTPVSRRFEDRTPLPKALFKAMRVHQWSKNALIFVPLLLSHSLSPPTVFKAVLAFFSFCFCASATYIVNDLLDLETDRHHPKKRFRPFASGDLSILSGLGLIALFTLLALAGILQLPQAFLLWIIVYFIATNVYSLYLKRIALVDVIVLSGLYTLRMLAGGAATNTPISHWLAAFATFLFLSLAMVKRYSELQNLRERGANPANGRGYLLSDVEQLRSFGTASAYSSVVVFAIYIGGHDVELLYRHAARMWLIAPLMILWLSRVWLLASRGELDEDPVIFALTDRMSIVIGLCVLAIALLSL